MNNLDMTLQAVFGMDARARSAANGYSIRKLCNAGRRPNTLQPFGLVPPLGIPVLQARLL